ncbi:MAG: RNA polymerase sigma factor [Candidatus Aminicenantales bacterium]
MDVTMTKDEVVFLPDIVSCDPASFEELYEMYRTHIYRFACALTGDTGEAEDLFQDTWLRVAQAFRRRPQGEGFRAWIFTIAANLHRDLLRKKKVRRMLSFGSGRKSPVLNWESGEASTGDHSVRTDSQMCLRRAISELRPKQRRIFILKQIEGFKHQEIGRILNIPENTVRTLFHRAVKRLQSELAEFDPAGTRLGSRPELEEKETIP